MAALEFLSSEWLAAYEDVVREAAAGEELSGVNFSMCEIFKDVPKRFSRSGGAEAFVGFRIDDGVLNFPSAVWNDATFTLIADYESIAPWLDLPAEQTRAAGVIERLHAAGKLRFSGDLTAAPKFVASLHDRLAEITARHTGAPRWGC